MELELTFIDEGFEAEISAMSHKDSGKRLLIYCFALQFSISSHFSISKSLALERTPPPPKQKPHKTKLKVVTML